MPTLLPPSSRPPGLSVLGSAAFCAIGLSALGGWMLATQESPVYGTAALLSGALLSLHTVTGTVRRIHATLAQSTRALRSVGQGDSSFRLSAHGLPEFDELLLAIDDLRGTVEPAAPPPRKSNSSVRTQTPAAVPAPRDDADPAWA